VAHGKITDLVSIRRYRPMTAYAKSRRVNVVSTQELADACPVGIVPFTVHPGSAVTSLACSGTRAVRPWACPACWPAG
jgi:hypothetical protein